MVMESDQVSQRLDWLDGERRKDRASLATIEERVKKLEESIPRFTQQIQELGSELTRVSTQLSRFNDIDAALVQMRVEQARAMEAMEKQQAEQSREFDRTRRADLETVNRSLGELRKSVETIQELKRSLQARVDEEFRLSRLIEEVDKKVRATQRLDEEYKRAQKLYEDTQRQDNRRLTDLQGEVSALRKRSDEQRAKTDLTGEAVRKVEQRLNEFQSSEMERRQTMTAFIERQTLTQVDRDRAWKDMQERFDTFAAQSANVDSQLQAIETTQRAVRRSQEAFDDITQRFERRINEITEMQRLVEERFRQEWVSFRADDQKRWTNYTLTQEELQRDFNRQMQKQAERLEVLEQISHQLSDQSGLLIEETQKQMQSLVDQMHVWLDDFNRLFGQGSK